MTGDLILSSDCCEQLRKETHKSSEDRLSSLPDTLIEAVLTRLPLQDALSTNALSRFWRYQWTTLPSLVFDPAHFRVFRHQFDDKITKIINLAFLFHRGPIHKFELVSTGLATHSYIELWVLFLSKNGIREFTLHNANVQSCDMPYSLFLCEEMVSLELHWCKLTPPASLNGFRNLRTLTLHCVSIESQNLEKLISDSPLLNKLELVHFDACTGLKLSAPNLIDLVIYGNKLENLCFERTPVLAKASLHCHYGQNGSVPMLMDILGTVPSIQSLELLGHACQIPSGDDVPLKLFTECRLLYLSFKICFEDMQEMLGVLCVFRSSPCLQKVDIRSVSYKDSWEVQSLEDFWEAQDDFYGLFLQLQIVNVTCFTGSAAELKFLQFLLANAPVLETVQIKLEHQHVADEMNILRTTNRFRRMSSKAELVICDDMCCLDSNMSYVIGKKSTTLDPVWADFCLRNAILERVKSAEVHKPNQRSPDEGIQIKLEIIDTSLYFVPKVKDASFY